MWGRMNNKVRKTAFKNTFIVVSILGIIMVALLVWAYMYYFHISEPEGLSLASWPETYTNDFEFRIEKDDNGALYVTKGGTDELDDYGLWVQITDDTGAEVYSHNKPDFYPKEYTASELYSFSKNDFKNGYTCFLNTCKIEGETYNYIVGFPFEVGKFELFYNGKAISRFGNLVRRGLLAALAIGTIFIVVYVLRFSGQLVKIEKGIMDIHARKYSVLKENGPFGNVYKALNELNENIGKSDEIQRSTDEKRNEWIANITHDLKTPLSPVKGFAEILCAPEKLKEKEIAGYGRTILKNIDYAEHLINDLKLTYQLDFKELPTDFERVCITRYVKEIVIELINNPSFSGRNLEFEEDGSESFVEADKILLKRAIENLVINALIHNPEDTKVCVGVESASDDTVKIIVKDNGRGMSEKEVSRLFDRYYRGGNTSQKTGGTGLGMAIARQIIEQSGGRVEVMSKVAEGTIITVYMRKAQ